MLIYATSTFRMQQRPLIFYSSSPKVQGRRLLSLSRYLFCLLACNPCSIVSSTEDQELYQPTQYLHDPYPRSQISWRISTSIMNLSLPMKTMVCDFRCRQLRSTTYSQCVYSGDGVAGAGSKNEAERDHAAQETDPQEQQPPRPGMTSYLTASLLITSLTPLLTATPPHPQVPPEVLRQYINYAILHSGHRTDAQCCICQTPCPAHVLCRSCSAEPIYLCWKCDASRHAGASVHVHRRYSFNNTQVEALQPMKPTEQFYFSLEAQAVVRGRLGLQKFQRTFKLHEYCHDSGNVIKHFDVRPSHCKSQTCSMAIAPDAPPADFRGLIIVSRDGTSLFSCCPLVTSIETKIVM